MEGDTHKMTFLSWLNEERNRKDWQNWAIRLRLIQKQPKTQGQAEAVLGYDPEARKTASPWEQAGAV